MNKTVKALYRQFRDAGYQARWALSNAKTLFQWRRLWMNDLVRIELVPDEEPYDWGDTQPTQEDRDLLDRMGVYGVLGQYRTDPEGEWQTADSIWGCGAYFKPDSPFENAYVPDIMAATMDELRDALKSRRRALQPAFA